MQYSAKTADTAPLWPKISSQHTLGSHPAPEKCPGCGKPVAPLSDKAPISEYLMLHNMVLYNRPRASGQQITPVT